MKLIYDFVYFTSSMYFYINNNYCILLVYCWYINYQIHWWNLCFHVAAISYPALIN